MAGMEFTFTADTSGLVAGLEAAIGPAKELERALDGDRDAAAELGAAGDESAAGLAAQAAAMDAAAASAGRANRQHAVLRDSFSESGAAASGLERGLRDMERGGRDAESAIGDLEGAAGDAASAGSGLGQLGSVLGPAALPAGIAALVTGIAAAAPALVATGLGFGAFAALAAPALLKVKRGLGDVSWAQQQYQLAKGIEKRDPSKSNLENEQKALAALKTTYADMPPPVRATVTAVHQLESAWGKASRSSGIQKHALSDLTEGLHIAKDAIPAVTTLAKAAEKPLAGLERSLDKGIKSSGFKSFIHDMAKEEKPAVKSLTNLGGALLGFGGNTLKKLAPISAPFINSLTHLTKAFGPGATAGLAAAAGDLTKIDNALASKSSLATIHGLEGLGKQSFGGLSTLAGGVTQLGTALHLLGKDTSGRSTLSKVLNDINKYAPGNGSNIVPKSMGAVLNPAGAIIEGIEKKLHGGGGSVHSKSFHVPIVVIPDVKSKGAGGIADTIRSSLAKASSAATGGAVKVKTKVDPGDVAGQISKATSGKHIDVKGHVTLSGLGAGIQKQIASLKIPDSKVKISVSVSGVGAVKSQMAGVVSAARSDAAAAKGALGSLAGAGQAAGGALSAGLAAGIMAGEGAVVAAATAVASAAASAVRAASGIQSPSKVWKALGKNMREGLVLGLEGGKSEVQAAARLLAGDPFRDSHVAGAIKKLRKDVREAFKENKITGGREDALLNMIGIGNKRLTGLVKQRQHLVAEIKAAQALSRSVRQGAIGSADITGIAAADSAGQQAAANPPSAPSSIQAGQKADLHNIRAFTADIRKLKKEGLDKTSIKELLAAGVSGGLPAAQQLLASGKKGVKESAKLQREIIDASKKLGVTGANAAYESGSDIGKGLAAGLKSELGTVVKAIDHLAKELVDEIRKSLGLPPLKGGKGGHGGGGHGHGHGGPGHHHPPVYTPGGGHLFGGGGGGQVMHPGHVTHVTHIHVDLDGREVARSVQTHTLQRARRNVSSGLKLSNRAA